MVLLLLLLMGAVVVAVVAVTAAAAAATLWFGEGDASGKCSLMLCSAVVTVCEIQLLDVGC